MQAVNASAQCAHTARHGPTAAAPLAGPPAPVLPSAVYADATATEPFTLIRLEPGSLRSWDYGDILPASPN